MKENIIQAIVMKMQHDLDCRQMAQLKAVLASELHNVEIIEKKDNVIQQAQENEHLLNSFISAKKIEGCSDKTLTYYRNTIERLLVTLWLFVISPHLKYAPIYLIIKKNINPARLPLTICDVYFQVSSHGWKTKTILLKVQSDVFIR